MFLRLNRFQEENTVLAVISLPSGQPTALDPYHEITWLLKIERIFCTRKLFSGSYSSPEKSLQKNRSIFGLENQSCDRRKASFDGSNKFPTPKDSVRRFLDSFWTKWTSPSKSSWRWRRWRPLTTTAETKFWQRKTGAGSYFCGSVLHSCTPGCVFACVPVSMQHAMCVTWVCEHGAWVCLRLCVCIHLSVYVWIICLSVFAGERDRKREHICVRDGVRCSIDPVFWWNVWASGIFMLAYTSARSHLVYIRVHLHVHT